MFSYTKYFILPLFFVAHLSQTAEQDGKQKEPASSTAESDIAVKEPLNRELMQAATCSNVEQVRSLIEQKANVDYIDRLFAQSCLLATASPKVAKALIDGKANVNLVINGESTLHIAVSCPAGGRPDIIKMLLENKANVEASDSDGMTAIHKVRHLDYLQLLLEHKANPIAQTPKGNTPIHTIALRAWSEAKDPEIIQRLIEAKVELNGKNSEGKTALHFAFERKNRGLANTLLQVNASMLIKDKEDISPLDIAFNNMQMTSKK